MIGQLSAQHRAVDFRDFLDEIDRQTEPGLAIHVICDNLSAHKAPVVHRWLLAHPRVQLHFTPTYSSWISQVERWFAELQRRCLDRGVFCSLDELTTALEDWIKIWNATARPFKWTKTADQIIDRICRYCSRISGPGHYASAATMMPEEHRPAVPELARRMTVCSRHADPARALVPVLTAMPGDGIPLGDILSDSGYAHRDAGAWAIPLRAAGAAAHPGPAPIRPRPARHPPRRHHRQREPVLPGHAPAAAGTRAAGPRRHRRPGRRRDRQSAELARYKLGRITSDDADGYHRVMCPAVMGKIRCPLRPASMTLDRNRPEILTPPEHPPACCDHKTITVPPDVAAKTRQKHDYPSRDHRRSCARRTGAERTFATTKDPASNNITRGWTRLMGLAPLMLWLACLLAVRNQRILTAWDARQAGNARRAAAGPLPENPAPAPQDPRQPGHRSAAITPAPPIPRPSPARPDHPDHRTQGTTCCPEQPPRPGSQP